MSVSVYPELVDHSFFPQPEGWSCVDDGYPVVPMTMIVQLFMEEATRLAKGKKAIRVENVQTSKWMVVEPPIELAFTGEYDGHERVSITIEGYASGTVIVAADYPAQPPARLTAVEPVRAVVMSAHDMYKNYLFHGPLYRAAVDNVHIGVDGVSGRIRMVRARGAVLDTAGQFFGLWIIVKATGYCMPFPIKIQRVSFFSGEPPEGEVIECAVRNIERGIAKEVTCTIELTCKGEVWCVIDHWIDYQFFTDQHTHEVLMDPGRRPLARSEESGLVWVLNRWTESYQRNRVLHRYTGKYEREQRNELPPELRDQRLMEIIVVKDALRNQLWRNGLTSIYPVEIETRWAEGKLIDIRIIPVPSHQFKVAVVAKGNFAAARLYTSGRLVMVLESLQSYPTSLKAYPMTSDEMKALQSGNSQPDITMEEWAIRLIAARNAIHLLLGRRISSSSHPLKQVEGGKVLLGDIWVEMERIEDFILATVKA
jgi:hypothetical protein